MNILAINSSPRAGNGSKTELMLNHLTGGMCAAGAKVEIVNLHEKKIKPCIGCFTCWTKTPGRCIHKDDMTAELFPKWLAADLAVYATPLYYHTMNGAMSVFIERTLPAIQPFFDLDEDGKVFHPLRYKVPAAVWLSVCGFPEASEFDALSSLLNHSHHKDVPLVAEIYRSTAESLNNPNLEQKTRDILDATEQAGRELVTSMAITPATMTRIRQPLENSAMFAAMGNLFWRTCIAAGVTPKMFRKQDMIPRPDSLESFMLLFPFGLNAEAAGDGKVVLQFIFSGQIDDTCFFTVGNRRVEATPGSAENPNLTIETPFELWADIMTRQADGQQMFMEKKYRVSGDIALMLQLFKREEDQKRS